MLHSDDRKNDVVAIVLLFIHQGLNAQNNLNESDHKPMNIILTMVQKILLISHVGSKSCPFSQRLKTF